MLWASLFLSLIATFIIASRMLASGDVRKGATTATYFSFGSLGMLCLMMFFPSLIGSLVLMAVFLWIGVGLGWTPKRAVIALPIALILGFGAAGTLAALKLREEMREHPMVSLEPRLRQLDRITVGTPTPNRSLQALYNQATNGPGSGLDWRAERLRHLHGETVTRFANSPGFGVIRMPSMAIPDPEPGETPFQKFTGRYGNYFHPQPEPGEPPADPVVERLTFLNLHTQMNFTDPSDFGYVESFRKAAGFVPHRYRSDERLSGYVPTPRGTVDNPPIAPTRIRRLELVSLLRFEQPAVYLSDQFPRMEQLADAPTRPLNPFESRNLPHLFDGENIRAEVTPGGVRMLGSIRAVTQCLDCHIGPEGRLLGRSATRSHPRANDRTGLVPESSESPRPRCPLACRSGIPSPGTERIGERLLQGIVSCRHSRGHGP